MILNVRGDVYENSRPLYKQDIYVLYLSVNNTELHILVKAGTRLVLKLSDNW
jgi:hypothetical protein